MFSISLLLAALAVLLATLALWKAFSTTPHGPGHDEPALPEAQKETSLPKQIEQYDEDLRALTSSAIAMGKRLQDLEGQVNYLSEKLQQLELHDGGRGIYLQAIRAASHGASADQLVADFDLAFNEAELIVSIHGRTR